MKDQDLLTRVAEQYRRDGYDVSQNSDLLPAPLRDRGVDLIAWKDNDHVAIQVKNRDQLYDLVQSTEDADLPPGWRFDLVVYPPKRDSVDVPQNGVPQPPGYALHLIQESEELLKSGSLRAALVLSWSAVEAALREAAQREDIELDGSSLRFALKSLYSAGVIAREDYDQALTYLNLRAEIVHGYQPANLSAEAPRFLLDFARRLHDERVAQVAT